MKIINEITFLLKILSITTDRESVRWKKMMSGGQSNEKIMELLEKGIKLPALPATGINLLSLIRKPIDNISIRDLTDLIKREPELAAKILKVANSPYYGHTREVSNLSTAVVIMGLEETISILNYFHLMKLTKLSQPINHFSMDDFWLHTWACAEASRMLGSPQHFIKSLPGELYLAGLFHDIGKTALAMYLPDEFSKCLELANEKNIPLYLAEREILSVDHAMFGATLLDNWNLPPSILDAVCFHHSPNEADPKNKEIAFCVYFANYITNSNKIGNGGNPVCDEVSKDLLKEIFPSIFATEYTEKHIVDEIVKSLKKKFNILEQIESSDLENETKKEEEKIKEEEKELESVVSSSPSFPVNQQNKSSSFHHFWQSIKKIFSSSN